MAFFCPICGEPEHQRERRPNGNSRCTDGHPYASSAALDEPTKVYTVLQHVPDRWTKYARQEGDAWVLGKTLAPVFGGSLLTPFKALEAVSAQEGPLAIVVADHQMAEALTALFAGLTGPYVQGVRVIPFGASALSYCGPGTLLFRALLVVLPRVGPISQVQFNAWVDQAVRPYLTPFAPTVVL